jgi:hypothetical protein
LPDIAHKNLEQRLNSQAAGESFVWEDMILYSDDEEAFDNALEAFDQFTDDTLWRILDYRIPYPQRRRRRQLIDNMSRSQGEEAELDQLMAIYDRFVLVRSQALLSLKKRGYDMDHYLKDQNS